MIAPSLARRLLLALVLAAASALAAGSLARSADAAKSPSCAKEVVSDWYDNGRIDYLYPLRCYREAIRILPPDVVDYSTAREEIERALADATNRPRVTRRTPLSSVPCKKGERCIDPQGVGGPGGPSDPNGPTSAGPDSGTSSASSVPIPLIVLGGLALLLLAAGSAGYLARRFGHGGDDEPSAPAT